ncbi:MAG TPA: amidase domain-containing protein [Patescibacteria group bacterium]|nr:amidase domain-containing protein [Patescibacteria group bacterium]
MAYDNDCANYVSQVMFAGGYLMNTSVNNPWYANYGPGYAYSQSWRLVQYNRGFFLTDGGSVIRAYYGVKTACPTGVSLGDIVYYAWYGDRTFATNAHQSQSVVTVLNGKATSTPETGVLVNAHSNDRYREFWTLHLSNPNWQFTYHEIIRTRRP